MNSVERLTAAIEARVSAPPERPAVILIDVPNLTASEMWFTEGAPVGSGRSVRVKLTDIEAYVAQWREGAGRPPAIILEDELPD